MCPESFVIYSLTLKSHLKRKMTLILLIFSLLGRDIILSIFQSRFVSFVMEKSCSTKIKVFSGGKIEFFLSKFELTDEDTITHVFYYTQKGFIFLISTILLVNSFVFFLYVIITCGKDLNKKKNTDRINILRLTLQKNSVIFFILYIFYIMQ